VNVKVGLRESELGKYGAERWHVFSAGEHEAQSSSSFAGPTVFGLRRLVAAFVHRRKPSRLEFDRAAIQSASKLAYQFKRGGCASERSADFSPLEGWIAKGGLEILQCGSVNRDTCALRTAFLSLLGADVQPDHGSSGFADDRIAIATPATFEPGFGREIAGQETKQDRKNNQACDRKQHRIANIHGPTVVRRNGLVKHVRPGRISQSRAPAGV